MSSALMAWRTAGTTAVVAGQHTKDIVKRGALAEGVHNCKKAYINKTNESTIICTQCGKTKIINVSMYKHLHKPTKVKCSCSFVFYIFLETRRFYRKQTNLYGMYWSLGSHKEIGEMTVQSLSLNGVGFKTNLKNNIKVDDILKIQFVLDNTRQSVVYTSIIVRRVHDRFVGAEFCEISNAALGFYLMP